MRHFGSLIPSTNTTVEIEFNQLLPDTLQLHVGRLDQRALGELGRDPLGHLAEQRVGRRAAAAVIDEEDSLGHARRVAGR